MDKARSILANELFKLAALVAPDKKKPAKKTTKKK